MKMRHTNNQELNKFTLLMSLMIMVTYSCGNSPYWEKYKRMEVNGVITKIEVQPKSIYLVRVSNNDTFVCYTKISTTPLQDKILEIGDSIHKDSNSSIVTLYRDSMGIMIKYAELNKY